MSFGREDWDSLKVDKTSAVSVIWIRPYHQNAGIVTWEDPDRRVAVLKKLSYKFVVGVIDASVDVNNSKICFKNFEISDTLNNKRWSLTVTLKKKQDSTVP